MIEAKDEQEKMRMNVSLITRRGMLPMVLAVLMLSLGCGGSDGQASNSVGGPGRGRSTGVASGSSQPGALKKTKWGFSQLGRRHVQIGAFVPYCGEPHPKPYIERVIRNRVQGRVVLTMLVRYPPVKGACLGMGIGVMRWVPVGHDPRKLVFYDGATFPPEKRLLP
jgi:hypothetical protein